MDAVNEMALGEIVTRVAGLVAVLSLFIQISPIKLNPWSWLFEQIIRPINKDVLDKICAVENGVKSLEVELNDVRNRMDERAARDARTKILRFGDEILHGTRHSKEHFDETLLSITEYTNYCAEHPEFKNHMTETTTRIIVNQYEKCMREHSFLEQFFEDESHHS